MYKKIVFTKSSSQNMEEINSLARTAIKDFLVNKGWTVKDDLSNGCNFCLIKNFNNQNNSVNFDNNKNVLNCKLCGQKICHRSPFQTTEKELNAFYTRFLLENYLVFRNFHIFAQITNQ